MKKKLTTTMELNQEEVEIILKIREQAEAEKKRDEVLKKFKEVLTLAEEYGITLRVDIDYLEQPIIKSLGLYSVRGFEKYADTTDIVLI